MFNTPQREHYSCLGPRDATVAFQGADVLFALEWSVVAPGVGGWDVCVDNETHPRLVSVVPPGSNDPTFLIFRRDSVVSVVWIAPNITGKVTEIGRFESLRTAVLALCPLPDDVLQQVNEAMELLYLRTLRRQ